MLVKTLKIRQKPTYIKVYIVCYIAKANFNKVFKGSNVALQCS